MNGIYVCMWYVYVSICVVCMYIRDVQDKDVHGFTYMSIVCTYMSVRAVYVHVVSEYNLCGASICVYVVMCIYLYMCNVCGIMYGVCVLTCCRFL